MKKKIFIVDDDIITLKILKKYLDEKYEVITENAGYRVIDKLDGLDVDLILLDLEMPVKNGVQVFEEMRKIRRLKDVPVVFLSGVVDPNIVRDLKAKGAVGFIVKTTPKAELIERIEQILSDAEDKKVKKSVLVIEGNITNLKSVRETLLEADYEVKAVQTMLDAVSKLNSYTPHLIIIGNDLNGAGAMDIYGYLGDILRKKDIQALIMEKMYFSHELLDKVDKALA